MREREPRSTERERDRQTKREPRSKERESERKRELETKREEKVSSSGRCGVPFHFYE